MIEKWTWPLDLSFPKMRRPLQRALRRRSWSCIVKNTKS